MLKPARPADAWWLLHQRVVGAGRRPSHSGKSTKDVGLVGPTFVRQVAGLRGLCF
jgi:hypothetical protein